MSGGGEDDPVDPFAPRKGEGGAPDPVAPPAPADPFAGPRGGPAPATRIFAGPGDPADPFAPAPEGWTPATRHPAMQGLAPAGDWVGGGAHDPAAEDAARAEAEAARAEARLRDQAQALRDALADLAADPSRWDFLAAARLIQAANPDMPRIGASDRISRDPARFGQIPTLAFSPSELRRYARRDPEDGGPMELMISFFGLWGPDGALPEFLTEDVIQRDDDGRRDETTPAFADIFHHRLVSLLYAAWERASIAAGRDRPGADPWEGWIGALQGAHGADRRAWAGRDALPEELRRRMSGWMSSGPKSAEGAAAVATEAIGAPIEVMEFVGEWLPISRDQRARFGPPASFGAEGGMRLGQDVVVGDRYFSLQTRIRLRTDPLPLDRYRDLLRSGTLFPVLRDAMRAYLGLALAWEIQPVLDVGEAPAPVLDGSLRLGWDCWLSDAPPMRDLDDLVLDGAYGGPGTERI